MRKGSMVASGVGQAILAASLSCSATLASAQEASKLGPQAARIEGEGRITGDIVRRVVYAYATCVVRHRRLKVIKWIALPRTDPDLSRKAYDFADDTCLENGDLQFSPLVLRGAIYSALYLAQFGRGGRFRLRP